MILNWITKFMSTSKLIKVTLIMFHSRMHRENWNMILMYWPLLHLLVTLLYNFMRIRKELNRSACWIPSCIWGIFNISSIKMKFKRNFLKDCMLKLFPKTKFPLLWWKLKAEQNPKYSKFMNIFTNLCQFRNRLCLTFKFIDLMRTKERSRIWKWCFLWFKSLEQSALSLESVTPQKKKSVLANYFLPILQKSIANIEVLVQSKHTQSP